jgi:CheY-like chemotaxis protein
LAGGIAHDLNNVLAPIVTGAGLLDGPGLDPDTRAIVETIVTSAQRGADLVRQVLAYARGVEGERVVVDVGASVSEVVAMIASTFPKDVHVDLELSEGLWEVVGDPTQLQQVVLNLCVNARDAVGSFGRIRVAARNVERPGSVLTTHGPRPIPTAGGRFVAIAVTDDGPGVPPELADRIFDPFVTTKPIGEGSGLGLATVASIVTGHGGAIDVRSHPGQGSTFEVLFPVQGDPQHTVRATLPARAVRPVEDRSLHVLLVDDERAIVETAQRVLESLGYRVTASWQSADLCASLEARVASGVGLDEPPADVVVTDLVMPEVDGGRLVRMIRSQWPDLPAVVMTGGDPGHVLDSVPGPTPVLLPKPFTAEALRNAVAAALDAAT